MKKCLKGSYRGTPFQSSAENAFRLPKRHKSPNFLFHAAKKQLLAQSPKFPPSHNQKPPISGSQNRGKSLSTLNLQSEKEPGKGRRMNEKVSQGQLSGSVVYLNLAGRLALFLNF